MHRAYTGDWGGVGLSHNQYPGWVRTERILVVVDRKGWRVGTGLGLGFIWEINKIPPYIVLARLGCRREGEGVCVCVWGGGVNGT